MHQSSRDAIASCVFYNKKRFYCGWLNSYGAVGKILCSPLWGLGFTIDLTTTRHWACQCLEKRWLLDEPGPWMSSPWQGGVYKGRDRALVISGPLSGSSCGVDPSLRRRFLLSNLHFTPQGPSCCRPVNIHQTCPLSWRVCHPSRKIEPKARVNQFVTPVWISPVGLLGLGWC